MSFTIDKQTLDDLNLLGRYKGNSIYNLFDHTHTRGGAQVLESMFQHPLTDAAAITTRSNIFRYFEAKSLAFPLTREVCEDVEHYLSSVGGSNMIMSMLMIGKKKFMKLLASDTDYELVHNGILATIGFLNTVNSFFTQLENSQSGNPCHNTVQEVKNILQLPGIKKALAEKGITHLSFGKVAQYDQILRHAYQQQLHRLMEIVYETDVYITVSRIAAEKKFVYAEARPFKEGENLIKLRNVKHPQLPGAIPNSIHTDYNQNVIFLTGANMAGKSTFMKSFGIAVYLGHMGFPIAAEEMIFSVQDGMYTSINVPDNLDQGYSHFYVEVLRVKHVAEEVASGKNLLIIFDELFKGTNVKDAYDATVAVTAAFSENRNSTFIVSTHIVEAGETLRTTTNNLQFVFFPTIMEKQVPRYTYKLEPGISADRHGMMIITNEGIVDIIRGKALAK